MKDRNGDVIQLGDYVQITGKITRMTSEQNLLPDGKTTAANDVVVLRGLDQNGEVVTVQYQSNMVEQVDAPSWAADLDAKIKG